MHVHFVHSNEVGLPSILLIHPLVTVILPETGGPSLEARIVADQLSLPDTGGPSLEARIVAVPRAQRGGRRCRCSIDIPTPITAPTSAVMNILAMVVILNVHLSMKIATKQAMRSCIVQDKRCLR